MTSPKYLLIVTATAGWNIYDTPRPQGKGALKRRAEPPGKPIYAYDILLFEGVPYAYLRAADPTRPEWGRVGEKGSVHFENGVAILSETIQHYVNITPLEIDSETNLAAAVNHLSDAITLLATSVRELAKKT